MNRSDLKPPFIFWFHRKMQAVLRVSSYHLGALAGPGRVNSIASLQQKIEELNFGTLPRSIIWACKK
jgi:hypothetical protein